MVYILTNKPRATLYVGVTNDLIRRTYEHREGLVKGFTHRYGLKMLVHFEKYDTPATAIQREKNIKHWRRLWKLQLVELGNPQGGTSTTTLCAEKPSWIAGSSPAMTTLRGWEHRYKVRPKRSKTLPVPAGFAHLRIL